MKPISLVFALLLLASVVQAASLNIIQLTNRPAAEVIPVIEPMLGPGDAISGSGFKIFLRASPDTVAEVAEIVAALDTPAKELQVSVFQGSSSQLREQGIRGSIQISNDDAEVSLSGVDTQQNMQNSPVHRVRVSEGRAAYIETGQQIPFFSGGYESGNLLTGFYVLPRVSGERVILEVSPFRNTLAGSGDGSIETQSAQTTITGRMGEWLLIGGVSEQSTSTQSGLGGQASSESSRNDSVWIRADLVR